MEELCTACLCAGRKLFHINETGHEHLYSQIINEMPMYNPFEICIRVCWECKALLRKLGDFKEQVKRCYTELLAYVQQNAAKPFPNYPRLQSLQVVSDSYPQFIKEEVDEYSPIDVDRPMNNDDKELDVKIEEHHCEPETFVKDLNMGKLKKKRNLKNVKKVEKEKEEVDEYSPIDVYIPMNNDDEELDVKIEEHHCEPATFVKDLNVGKLKKKRNLKNVKKVEKPIKEKTKRKVKIKPQKKTPKAVVEVSRRISRTVESIIQSTVNDCYNKQEDVTEDDHISEDVAEDVTEDDHISEDVTEDVTEDDNTPEDVEKEEKVKIKMNLSNGVKIPKAVALKEVLSDKPVCSECGKTFSSRKTYRYHLNVLHKGQNRYPCPRCGKVYQWKSNLGRHMRSHKARDSGELYCETCDKRFASVATYRQHLRISRRHVSESEFSFMCNECGKKFVNKTRLRDHIDWEHLKKIKFKCQLCNKPFKCHTSLYVHLQNVHRSKDKKENLCHVCGKSYQNAAKLKYHIVAMHTSETPYQCQQCSAAFGWYSSLYRHVREVHYKMKVQPKKSKKPKKSEMLPSLLPVLPQQIILPQIHQPGPA